MGEGKKFSMLSCVLTVICVVFVAEAAAPVAAIGNAQYFWWVFMIVCFLFPYGLIAAELGTAYDGGGGLYDWVKAAYGHRWGARIAWYYWINFPLWMASLAVEVPDLAACIIGKSVSHLTALVIELLFVVIVTGLACTPTAESIWVLNLSAAIKVLLAVGIGVLGIYGAGKNGLVNTMEAATFLPGFNSSSLSFISVIIFNMLGFEVICTMSEEMENPHRQIPKAILLGGMVIAFIYMFSAFGIGAAIPVEEINTESGLLDAYRLLMGGSGGKWIQMIAFFFGLTLFGNMISWSDGVHQVAAYGADQGDMPSIFGKRSRKSQKPIGGILTTAVVATMVLVLAFFISDQDLFWNFFALNLVMFLLSYVPMFPGFLHLRKQDPDRVRPFRVPGGALLLQVMAYVPMILLLLAIGCTALPLSGDPETVKSTLPITIGALLFIGGGEIMLWLVGARNVRKGGEGDGKKN